MSPDNDRSGAVPAVELFTAEYGNRAVLMGEMAAVCAAGVCRHRALLFKMMADEAGLKTSLVRGNLHSRAGGGGHAWNELILDDSSKVIVDVMNPQRDFSFPSITNRAARVYYTIDDQPMYPVPASAPPAPASK